MKKPILIGFGVWLCLLLSNAFGQSSKPNPTAPKFNPTERLENACGVKQSLNEYKEEAKQEWRVAASTNDKIFVYNTQKLTCDQATRILRIWVKVLPRPLPAAPDYSIQRFEINCRSNRIRLASYVDYDHTGKSITSNTNTEAEWEDVIPDSAGEDILETVCHKSL